MLRCLHITRAGKEFVLPVRRAEQDFAIVVVLNSDVLYDDERGAAAH
jgi:hypothetical protein